jgi:hypothetical protein
MNKIKVERHPSEARLQELGVAGWPLWTKEASEFPWTYDEPETCYFLEGMVTGHLRRRRHRQARQRGPGNFPRGPVLHLENQPGRGKALPVWLKGSLSATSIQLAKAASNLRSPKKEAISIL